MVRSWRMLGGMAMLAVAALAPVGAMAETLKVMTFNVRYASDEGAERWAARRPVMVELIRRAVPDVIGTQELLQRQGTTSSARCPAIAGSGVTGWAATMTSIWASSIAPTG